MLPRDIFARTIEFPTHFSNNCFDVENYIRFQEDPEGTNHYALSVASRRILREPEQVHHYGRSVVEIKNRRFLAENLRDPDPAKSYVGYYDFYAECVLSLQLDFYLARIRWKPEHGFDAHFQVELIWNGMGGRKTLKKLRREVRHAIYYGSIGPIIAPEAEQEESLSECISSLEVMGLEGIT